MTPQSAPGRLVGVIPAAGKGARISPLPGSKELFPIGFTQSPVNGQARRYPKVVSQYLVDSMRQAGVQHIYFILSEGKWDLLKYYGDGQRVGVNIAYLMVEQMIGMPYTINQAYPWVENDTIIFGMPDTIFTPTDAFSRLLAHHKETTADLTLGLFPTQQPWRFGMVDLDSRGTVLSCVDKPAQSDLRYMWGIACWSPGFSAFLNQSIRSSLASTGQKPELVLGDFFQRAIEEKMNVQSVCFDQGQYVDIGSPDELELTMKRYINED